MTGLGAAVEPNRTQLVPIPVLFYTSDTGVAGGGLLVAIHHDDDDTETFSINLAATLAAVGHVEFSATTAYAVPQSPWKLESMLGAFRSPEILYGPVNRDYLLNRFEAEGTALRKLGRASYGGVAVRSGFFDYEDLAELDHEDGSLLQLAAVLRHDTRDNPRYPFSGTVMELRPRVGFSWAETNARFSQISVDVSHYVALPGLPYADRPSVLALQSQLTISDANTPRIALPSQGGSRVLRGYAANRFTARHAAALQAELRTPLSGTLALVAFGAAGAADDHLDRLFTHVRYAGGGGLRLAMNRDRDVNLRFDAGFSLEGARFYITLMEAF